MKDPAGRSPWLVLAVAITITLILYGSALALPLFSDDLLQVPWAATHPPGFIVSHLTPYGDYRPLHFLLWHLLLHLGLPAAITLHALNLLGQMAAVALLGLLLLREGNDLGDAIAALTLFALYPFAFDAVLWASALSYPLSVAFALAALLMHLRAVEQERSFSIAALFLALMAALSYEGGIVAGPLLLLGDRLLARRRPFAWAVLVYPVGSSLVALLIAGHALGEGFRILWERIGTNLLAWWQALCYPVAPVARWMGSMPALWLVGFGGVALLGVGYGAWKARRWRWFLFGLGWALLWGAIPVATQPFEWSRDPLRVFYPVGIGSALLWWSGVHFVRRWRGMAPLLLMVLILPALLFLHREVQLYHRAGVLIEEIVAATRGPRCADGLLFINLPGRVSLRSPFYPLGHEGVIPLPPPTDIEALTALNGGTAVPVAARAAGWILPPLPYAVEPAGPLLGPDDFRAARCVMLTDFAPAGEMHLWPVAERSGLLSPQPAVARFDVGVALLSWSCHPVGNTIELRLRWQKVEPTVGSPTVFVHLLADDRHTILAQADGDPIVGLYPVKLWAVGERVDEVRRLPALDGGRWIRLGMWEPGSGQRAAAVDAEGRAVVEGFLWCRVGDGP